MDVKSICLLMCTLLVLESISAVQAQYDGFNGQLGQVAKSLGYGNSVAPSGGQQQQQGGYGANLNQYLGQFGGLYGGNKGTKVSPPGAGQKQFGFENVKGLEIFGGLSKGISYGKGSETEPNKSVPSATFFEGIQKTLANPTALAEYISTTFKIPIDQLKGLLNQDDLLTKDGHPISKSVKILERVFVPNECRLKVLCQIGVQMGRFKEQMSKIPPRWFEGSGYYKALNQGVIGEDCLVAYTSCKQGDVLVLANPFARLRLTGGSITEEKKETAEVDLTKAISVGAVAGGIKGLTESLGAKASIEETKTIG